MSTDLVFLFLSADGKKTRCKFDGVSSHADLGAKLREKLADEELKIEDCELWLADYDEWAELAGEDLKDLPSKGCKIRVKGAGGTGGAGGGGGGGAAAADISVGVGTVLGGR